MPGHSTAVTDVLQTWPLSAESVTQCYNNVSPSLLMVHPQHSLDLSSSKNWLSVSLNWSNWGPSVVQARATVGDGRWCELILMVSTLNIVFIFSPSATEGQSPRDDDVSATNQSPVFVPNWPMRGDHVSSLTGVSVTNVTWRLVSDWGRVSPGAGEREEPTPVVTTSCVGWPLVTCRVSCQELPPPGSGETHLHCQV